MGEEKAWPSLGEIRFLLVRALLEEFPSLRGRVIEHLKKTYPGELKP